MQDRREHERFDVEIDGRLIVPGGTGLRDCTILDLSDGGARIAVPGSSSLPRTVYLWERKSGTVFECEVRWRGEHTAGLRFVDTCGRRVRDNLLAHGTAAPVKSRIARWLGEGAR
jgi:hypothetical protein